MIVLHFSMQGEYFFNVLMEIVMCLHFGLQKEDISKHSNSKCPREVHSIVKLNTTCNKKNQFVHIASPKWVKILLGLFCE